jgi:hypothetical protein
MMPLVVSVTIVIGCSVSVDYQRQEILLCL